MNVPSSQKIKEGQTYIEFHEDDVQDSVLESVIRLAYKMFKVCRPHLEVKLSLFIDTQ